MLSDVEDDVVMSSADSSSPDDEELELGLCLSIGGSFASFASASSTSASSSLSREPDALSSAGLSQAVGWPPIRSYRMNNMVNQGKSLASSITAACVHGIGHNPSDAPASTLFMKVNMDGSLIGRKVNLNAHSCYETLARTLEDMFLTSKLRLDVLKYKLMVLDGSRSSRLLDATSEYVLAYEDKDGDWMLAGDVPWDMFLRSVKRLRIVRRSEATILSKNMDQST